MRTKWLDSTLFLGPYLALVASSEEYDRVTRRLTKGVPDEWLGDHATAAVHTFEHSDEKIACVVAIKPGLTVANAALTLSHEALHVFRKWCEYIGEDKPGEEIEAHSIKSIAVSLTEEYIRRDLVGDMVE